MKTLIAALILSFHSPALAANKCDMFLPVDGMVELGSTSGHEIGTWTPAILNAWTKDARVSIEIIVGGERKVALFSNVQYDQRAENSVGNLILMNEDRIWVQIGVCEYLFELVP